MAKEVLCPICGATYNLADEQIGKKVRCKKCEHPFTAGGERKRDERDDEDDDRGVQDRPRGRSKAKKSRDDEEYARKPKKTKSIDEQAKPRSEQGPGSPVTAIVLTGVAVGVLVLCCGGGGVVWWVWPQQANNPVNNPPNFGQPRNFGPPNAGQPNFGPPPNFGQPNFGPGGMAPAVANLKEALDFVRGNDPARRNAGADWFARNPRDEAKAAEVSKALDPMLRSGKPGPFGNDNGCCTAALQAVKVWGTKENVPALVDFLKAQIADDPHWIHVMDQLKDAMDALAMIGDDRGVDGIIPFAGSFHNIHLGGHHEQALRRMGPKAENGLRRYANDPNPGIRDLANKLLREMGK
jgi:predicted Zn finger-like uncharacterized protein